VGARGIAAEILFCGKAAKKIGAESPVFFGFGLVAPATCRKKRAQTLLLTLQSSLLLKLHSIIPRLE
jgi:hypothetical protein